MNILILEDEIPAFEKLLQHVGQFFNDDFEYDWARAKSEAKAYLEKETEYNLIISDIKLLDGTSFELFNEVEITCPIIFCSAYNEYLMDAFKSNGIAYILKPYNQADIRQALLKYKTLFEEDQARYNYKDLLQEFKKALSQEDKQYKKRFVINKNNGIVLLDAFEISAIEASGDFCKLFSKDGKIHSISQNIGSLIELMDPAVFFRINRSQIVQMSAIESIGKHFKNRLVLQLTGVKEKMMTSTSTTANFRKWIEQ